MDMGTVGIAEAAQMCAVSDETIRRRLRRNLLVGAHRTGIAGEWRIPVTALIEAGFTPNLAGSGDNSRAVIRELEVRLEAASALAEERLARVEHLEAHLHDLRSVIDHLRSES